MKQLDSFVASLLAQAPKMSFMQLCRLLDARLPDASGLGAGDTAAHEPVRFRPRPRTGFPAGEIVSVEFDDAAGGYGIGGAGGAEGAAGTAAPPTVRTAFMGLYGVDAAMPTHMIDEIVLREEGHEVVETFLDQFNHRFTTMLYRAWKKYRYPESFLPGGCDMHSRNLLCLAGFGWGDKPQRAGLPGARLLALLGLLIQRTRTSEGLAGVVALAVPGAAVRVDEFFPVMARAGQPQPLTSVGSNAGAGLGGGYVLGQRLTYRSRAVRVTLRPPADAVHDLLPGAWLHRELMAFAQLYVGVKADVHLRMEISSRLMPQLTIGQSEPAPRLGWTAMLPVDEERPIHIALGVYEAFPTSTFNLA